MRSVLVSTGHKVAKHRHNTTDRQTHQTTLIEVTETHVIGSKQLSVKMDDHRYSLLKKNASAKDMTHRAIMLEAFDLWLRVHGAA